MRSDMKRKIPKWKIEHPWMKVPPLGRTMEEEFEEAVEEENERLMELEGKKKHESAMLKAKKKAYPWARF